MFLKVAFVENRIQYKISETHGYQSIASLLCLYYGFLNRTEKLYAMKAISKSMSGGDGQGMAGGEEQTQTTNRCIFWRDHTAAPSTGETAQ